MKMKVVKESFTALIFMPFLLQKVSVAG